MQPFYPAVGLPQPADATSQVRPEYVIPNHQIGTDTAPQLPALLQVKPQVTRASRACTGCRSKKTKCDEGQPCSVCEREGLECVFPIRPPTKQEKVLNNVISNVANLKKELQELGNSFKAMKQNINERLPPSNGQKTGSPVIRSKDGVGLRTDLTASVHLLLSEWKHVSTFYHGNVEYPTELESRRGLLRVWGVGEGYDTEEDDSKIGKGYDTEEDSEIGKGYDTEEDDSEIGKGYDTQEENSGIWGQSSIENSPDLSLPTLERLFSSFLEHVHNMHPFLDPHKLWSLVKKFGEKYSPQVKAESAILPSKRKRSESILGQNPERSLHTATVLLVLALGSVCQYKEKKLPSPLSYRNRPSNIHPRNIDILPGMVYFAPATDILGSHQTGLSVAHAQAMLLAALYVSQYSRVSESWGWLDAACRICYIHVKADFARDNSRRNLSKEEKYRLDLIKAVYWTCHQLETEILTEMNTFVPHELFRYEITCVPDLVFAHVRELTSMIYLSLISLRKISNRANNALYRATTDTKPLDFVTLSKNVHIHADSLKSWRKELPPELAWDDEDPPSTNIHIAQLRAKYHGVFYMIRRPILHAVIHRLDISPHGSDMKLAEECIRGAVKSTIAFDRVGANPEHEYVRYVSQREGRLPLTNTFGTLHAQFGNIVVLTEVYLAKRGRLVISRDDLCDLFARTIDILKEVEPNSPVLRKDLKFLLEVKDILNLEPFRV